MTKKVRYYLRIGSRRFLWMHTEASEKGDEYAFFHFDCAGFHIAKHPLANPHLKDSAGFRFELDMNRLRALGTDPELEALKGWWESRFYWPNHRADLVAFPGPPGKSWAQGITDACQGEELDLIAVLGAALGHGIIYKVGYRERKNFFQTELGRGALIWDKKEKCIAFYAGEPFPDRPLFRIDIVDGSYWFPMPEPLGEWKRHMDYRLEIAAEEYFENNLAELEKALEEVAPELEAFVENFRIVRWAPSWPREPVPIAQTEGPDVSAPMGPESR